MCPPKYPALQLRLREKTKEIHPPFTVRAKSGKEKPQQVLSYNKQLLNYTCGTRDNAKTPGQQQNTLDAGRGKDTHYPVKTHFKAIQGLSLGMRRYSADSTLLQDGNAAVEAVKQASGQVQLNDEALAALSKGVLERYRVRPPTDAKLLISKTVN